MRLEYFEIDKETQKAEKLKPSYVDKITSERRMKKVYVVSICGSILGGNGTRLDRAIKTFGNAPGGYEGLKLLLDMSGIPLIDSAGVGVLMDDMKCIKENSGELVLANIPQPVEQVLEFTRAKDMFRQYHSTPGSSMGEYAILAFSAPHK
ncbi:STAS domain-containing protein [Candidatus Poribacteria bacterium]